MSNDDQEKTLLNKDRRQFISNFTVSAVAGAVAAGVTVKAKAKESKAVEPEQPEVGYHETQHIRDYYDSL